MLHFILRHSLTYTTVAIPRMGNSKIFLIPSSIAFLIFTQLTSILLIIQSLFLLLRETCEKTCRTASALGARESII
jgi:hypothetical protein